MTTFISSGRYQRRGEDGPICEEEDNDVLSIDDSSTDVVEVPSKMRDFRS